MNKLGQQREANGNSGGPVTVKPPSAPEPLLWLFGHVIYGGFSWLYDYVFFGFVIFALGPIKGGVILCVSTALIDYYSLKIYKFSNRDLLGIEYIRSFRNYRGRNVIKLCLGYILNHAPTWLQIAALTPKSNAFLTTALLGEEGFSFGEMSNRDWQIFWGSFLCSQFYWIGMIWLGIEGLGELIQLIAS